MVYLVTSVLKLTMLVTNLKGKPVYTSLLLRTYVRTVDNQPHVVSLIINTFQLVEIIRTVAESCHSVCDEFVLIESGESEVF